MTDPSDPSLRKSLPDSRVTGLQVLRMSVCVCVYTCVCHEANGQLEGITILATGIAGISDTHTNTLAHTFYTGHPVLRDGTYGV